MASVNPVGSWTSVASTYIEYDWPVRRDEIAFCFEEMLATDRHLNREAWKEPHKPRIAQDAQSIRPMLRYQKTFTGARYRIGRSKK